jgi:hypothetical protein
MIRDILLCEYYRLANIQPVFNHILAMIRPTEYWESTSEFQDLPGHSIEQARSVRQTKQ